MYDQQMQSANRIVEKPKNYNLQHFRDDLAKNLKKLTKLATLCNRSDADGFEWYAWPTGVTGKKNLPRTKRKVKIIFFFFY